MKTLSKNLKQFFLNSQMYIQPFLLRVEVYFELLWLLIKSI